MKKKVKRISEKKAQRKLAIKLMSFSFLLFAFLLMFGSLVSFFSDVVVEEKFASSGNVYHSLTDLRVEKKDRTRRRWVNDPDNTHYVETNDQFKEGDINTFEFTVTNISDNILKLSPVISIAWNDDDLDESASILLYPASMSDRAIRRDISNGAENALGGVEKIIDFDILTASKKLQGLVFDNLGFISLDLEDPDDSYTFRFKVVFIPSEAYTQKYNEKDLLIKIETKSTFPDPTDSIWAAQEEALVVINNAYVEPKPIDTKAPIIISAIVNRTDWYNKDKIITVTAQDEIGGSGIASYCITDSADVTICINNPEETHEFNVPMDTYYIKVIDNEGNTSESVMVVVDKIDKEDPIIDLIKVFPDDWSKEYKTITITAHDEIGGSDIKHYCVITSAQTIEDCEDSWTTLPEFTKDAGSYIAIVQDKAGNKREVPFEVTNVDKNPPVIDNITKTNADSSGFGTITITAHDSQSGLKEYCLININQNESSCDWVAPIPMNNDPFTFDNVLAGDYYVLVKDNVDRETRSETITIEDAPLAITSVGTLKEWANNTSSGAGHTIVVEATGPVTAYCISSTSSDPLACTTWISSTDKKHQFTGIKVAGTYHVFITDGVGGYDQDQCVISSSTFDNNNPQSPTISITNQGVWAPYKEIRITASDNPSGNVSGVGEYCVTTTSSTPAANNSCWQSSNIAMVTQPGNYWFWVKDNAGNISGALSYQFQRERDRLDPDLPKFTSTPYAVNGNEIRFYAQDVPAGQDGSGIVGYYLTTDPSPSAKPDALTPGWVSQIRSVDNKLYSITGVTAGTTYYIYLIDQAGNVSDISIAVTP